MSIKTLLMPAITQRLLSADRLLARRARAERRRLARCEPHRLHYFHQADDPYSALTAQALPRLLARYALELQPHVVGAPAGSAAPERAKLVAYSRVDAQRLAPQHGLVFADPLEQPPQAALDRATAVLVAAAQTGRFAEVAGPVSDSLWRDEARPSIADHDAAEPAAVSAHLASSQATRDQLGHYLGATFFYGGEWYWGLDRLHHLETRLQALGAQKTPQDGLLFAPSTDLQVAAPAAPGAAIDFFFSLRSPYSAIVAPRVFDLGRLTGAPVHLRYVLPMVMRGLPVPRVKRTYIALDAAREARLRSIPFGRLNDPVGQPTERGLALIPLAERLGRGADYVLSFMRGVWAEGIDAGSDRGLRRIAERAGLAWADCQAALRDEAWRAAAERHREQLFALGLWGVPSFRVGATAVWGQDRLWAVREALRQPPSSDYPGATP